MEQNNGQFGYRTSKSSQKKKNLNEYFCGEDENHTYKNSFIKTFQELLYMPFFFFLSTCYFYFTKK